MWSSDDGGIRISAVEIQNEKNRAHVLGIIGQVAVSSLQTSFKVLDASELDEMSKENGNQLIPNIIHFVWVDPSCWETPTDQPPISSDVLERAQAWKMLHPGWSVIVWTNESLLRHFPDLYKVFTSLSINIGE